ncbi:FCD domain-containing protein [Paenibacillus spongiae]|uniref:FCD domain-containing protein n=1 Tax=Paenibacillus spongiae TaxID=2909671 RepID=A0ABY5SLV3_9BACL|nr:FCD domain-containing protein [Paenibacillus spongiae]UVI33672.1 FCD domain-containing protein [Paenibacillus spongiae]
MVTKMNDDLHGMILRYCGNRTMEELITMYIERILRYLSFIKQELDSGILAKECQEHIAIAQSMLARDRNAAVSQMRRHLTESHQRTKQLIQA